MPALTVPETAPATLPRRYAEACELTDRLFQVLHPDAWYLRPIPERHRLIFYRGHLEAFDWNLLSGRLLGESSFHPAFDRLFAFGIDPVDGNLPIDQPRDWPTRDEVEAYCAAVRDRIRRCLTPARWQSLPPAERDQFMAVALEHRLMHAETLAYLFHQVPYSLKLGQPDRDWPEAPPPAPRRVSIPPGEALLGRSPGEGFGWDNEFMAHRVSVPAFEVDAWPVTNAAFLAFVEAGGYQQRELWTDAGWAWKASVGQQHPFFWRSTPHGWRLRGMFAERPLPLAAPVLVTWAEAAAFARWQGAELPTEAEWHRAAYATPEGGQRAFPWGDEAPGPRHGHFDFAGWDPAPVHVHPAGQSAFGVHDLLGNAWEWTSTLFSPFPGFEPFAFYPGYSANFFDGQHYVLKGGSSQTAACMLRRSFRNWFQPHYPYVYATFRCVAR